MSTNTIVRKYMVIGGRCQGVGFRWSTQRIALELGLHGWVRNLANGHVDLEIQGTIEQIAAYKKRIKEVYSKKVIVTVCPITFISEQEIPIKDDTTFEIIY